MLVFYGDRVELRGKGSPMVTEAERRYIAVSERLELLNLVKDQVARCTPQELRIWLENVTNEARTDKNLSAIVMADKATGRT